MRNEFRVIGAELGVYSQNQAQEITLNIDEARKTASNLILLASEILDFTGDDDVSRIIYSADNLLNIKF